MTVLRAQPQPPTVGCRLSASGLRLQLVNTLSRGARRRTDDGYYSHPAHIALSTTLCAGFSCDDVILSHEAIGRMQLTMRQAWNRAAANALHLETDSKGVVVRTRPTRYLTGLPTPGLQVDFEFTDPTAWLAHPHTFKTLYLHLSNLLREEACFYAVSDTVLIATGLCDPRVELESWIASLEVPKAKVKNRIYYRNGFPSTTSSARYPTPQAAASLRLQAA